MFAQGSFISLLAFVIFCLSFIAQTFAGIPTKVPTNLYKLPTCPEIPSHSLLPPPYPGLVLKAILFGDGTQSWSCGWGSFGSPRLGLGKAEVWDVGRLVYEDPAFFRSLSTDSLLRGTMASNPSFHLNPDHQLGLVVSQRDSFNFYRWNSDITREIYFTGTVYASAEASNNPPKTSAEDGMGSRRPDGSLAALDWLKLKGVGNSQSMEVYRVSTVGGQWRGGFCIGLPAEKILPYRALFWFYGPPERRGITLGEEPKPFCESLLEQ